MPTGWNAPTNGWVSYAITLNAAANGLNLGTGIIANGTPFDLFLDVSVRLTSYDAGTAAPFAELHLVPLLDDGTTYADAWIGGPTFAQGVGMTTGLSAKAVLFGTPRLIPVRPGSFKLALGNRTGGAWVGGTVAVQTYKLA